MLVRVVPMILLFALTAPAVAAPEPAAPPAGAAAPAADPELRLELVRTAARKGRLVLKVYGSEVRKLRKGMVVVFAPADGRPRVLGKVRWRGSRLIVDLPPELRKLPGRIWLARRERPGRPLSTPLAFRPTGAPRIGLPAGAAPGKPSTGGAPEPVPPHVGPRFGGRPLPPPPGPQRPCPPGRPDCPREPRVPIPLPEAGADGLPRPMPLPAGPFPPEIGRRPSIERVVHVAGREVYPFVARWLLPYSRQSLATCLALDPEEETVVALEGRRFGDRAEGRRVRLSRGGRMPVAELPVTRWSDSRIEARIPAEVEDRIFGPGVVAVAPHRFELVDRDGRVVASREVELCRRQFTLTVELRFENCIPTDDTPFRILDIEGGPVRRAGGERRAVSPYGRTYVLRYRIAEGETYRLRVDPVEDCRYGRWREDSRSVGPALHRSPDLRAAFVHRTEPVIMRVPVETIQATISPLLDIGLRLHNWPGARTLEQRNASWVRVSGRTYRFTIPRFYRELGGFADPLIPDLVSFVNDIRSTRVTVTVRPEGERLTARVEASFEDEGVELKNYANAGSDSTGDALYPDAHLDHGRAVMTGFAIGWDATHRRPAVVGTPRVTVDVAFDLRGGLVGESVEAAGRILPIIPDFERVIERTAAREAELALGSDSVRSELNRALLDGIDEFRRLRGLPPVASWLGARVEGDAFVLVYVPR